MNTSINNKDKPKKKQNNKVYQIERENIRDSTKFYDVKTYNEDTKQIYHEFKNDEDYSNKICFYNGNLAKVITHNKQYIHLKPYTKIYEKHINTSTIYYNDSEYKNYYKFEASTQPLLKVRHNNIRLYTYIFEPDNDLFNKTFITDTNQSGEDLRVLIDDDELINHQFKTQLKKHMDNILAALHFPSINQAKTIDDMKSKFKEAFKFSSKAGIINNIKTIYPIGTAYNENYINNIYNIIDELIP